MRPLIYMAGPITGEPLTCVRTAIDHAQVLNTDYGLDTYLPQLSVLHELIKSRPYDEWIEFGLNMVRRCDGLYRVDGPSKGADKEVAHAIHLGVPVMHPDGRTPLDDWLDGVWDRFRARYPREA